VRHASRPAVAPWILAAAALGLFVVWSNSFIAIGYLLGADRSASRFDWVGLTVARFLPAAAICCVYCFGFRRKESLAILRIHWPRLAVCAVLSVPGYNLALYYGQQHGVPAPVASLTTALLPLFVMLLAAATLGEPLTRRRVTGFLVAAGGMALIATAQRGETGTAYPLLILVTALAPLSWSLYSVVSKPVTGRIPSLLWTHLSITLGGAAVAPLLPAHAWASWTRLDAPGWFALLYLSIPCTVIGFALWTWLLKHLPAATVGFTVFLNPPLTTVSKVALAALVPSVFVFSVSGREMAGGSIALLGLAVAVFGRPRRRARKKGRR